jgi:GMP synthase (glutamine-hydrolysing)
MANKALQALVFTHLPFEDLGTLEPRLTERGFQIKTVDVTTERFPLPDAAHCDLLVIMGGPIGVYDAADYPFLSAEIECIRELLAAQKPTLGVCLGAQLIAAALGARVYPGGRGSEIGWSPIHAPAGGEPPSWFKPLLDSDVYLLHWHGDTFDIPSGTIRLAETELYQNQAFLLANFALGLQFHPEVTAEGLERWYVGHACELRSKRISVQELRSASARHAPILARAAQKFWNGWLNSLFER